MNYLFIFILHIFTTSSLCSEKLAALPLRAVLIRTPTGRFTGSMSLLPSRADLGPFTAQFCFKAKDTGRPRTGSEQSWNRNWPNLQLDLHMLRGTPRLHAWVWLTGKLHELNEVNGIFEVYALPIIAHLDLIGFMQTNHFGENATLLLPEGQQLWKQSTHQIHIRYTSATVRL